MARSRGNPALRPLTRDQVRWHLCELVSLEHNVLMFAIAATGGTVNLEAFFRVYHPECLN